jgi:cardiolipin synthase (CMP-forming)
MIAQIPNLISVLRLLLVPLVAYFVLDDRMIAAFWVFVAAGVSDAVDGFIAKRFNATSLLGKALDPIADKALLVTLFVLGGYMDFLSVWLVILVVFRDLMIVGGAILFHTIVQSLAMPPLAVSKLNTALQIVLVAAALAFRGYELDLAPIQAILEYAVAATTLASGVAYLVKWSRWAAVIEKDKSS